MSVVFRIPLPTTKNLQISLVLKNFRKVLTKNKVKLALIFYVLTFPCYLFIHFVQSYTNMYMYITILLYFIKKRKNSYSYIY